ncbi:MAG: macro domain-containing protein [Fibrobacteres bacterium]|nr:macro domain-containing protein [Fibrobacterota bacterium]
MTHLHLHFADTGPDVCHFLREAFAPFPEVSVQTGNILAVAHGCVVSPANSSGYMDGGVDAAYRTFFGASFETKVRAAIQSQPNSELPIGSAIVVATNHHKIPFVIVAPTMTMPEFTDASVVRRAMGAVLRAWDRHQSQISDVFCPGMGAGVGGVSPQEAVSAMAQAYLAWKGDRTD